MENSKHANSARAHRWFVLHHVRISPKRNRVRQPAEVVTDSAHSWRVSDHLQKLSKILDK